MIIIPLEERNFTRTEIFDINLVLDENTVYEIAILNIYPADKLKNGIGRLTCNIINPSVTNPRQIIGRFSRSNSRANPEYYIIDTFNLRSISLTLTGIEPTRLAITLAIRKLNAKTK